MYKKVFFIINVCLSLLFIGFGENVNSQSSATTTLSLSICGNALVDVNEECDVPGETGVYSQTIVGRQCNTQCQFGPYCGDGILQTVFGEECDDGNNQDNDFCSALCKVEPAGSGGGGSGGGGGGGSKTDLGDSYVSVRGRAYPSATVNFLIDSSVVGTVVADKNGNFTFSTKADPGSVTLGIWATDKDNNRSVTLNNTFDVTQGAVTNLSNVILPPTLKLEKQEVDPGDVVKISGQATPNSIIEFFLDKQDNTFATVNVDSNGNWEFELDTANLSVAEHIIRAKTLFDNDNLQSRSGFSQSWQVFVGVEGRVATPSDLNRDGFVNLIDFSILIFWWQTNGGDSDPPADINGNGRVGLEDFSIMLFNWTG